MKALKLAVLAVILIMTFTACESNNQDVNSVLSPTMGTASALPMATPEPTKVPMTPDMPASIGLYYKDRDDRVRRLVDDSFVSFWQEQQDIECFEVFLTREKEVPWGTYQNVWRQFYSYDSCKIGYYLKVLFTDNTEKTIKILKPEDTKSLWEYLEIYIYDDVNQTPGQWYSHLEEDDYTKETICSSIKLTPGAKIDQISSMELAAFTYKDMSYFTEEGDFLGHISTVIKVLNKARQGD
ncbi:MAG: hypothetical protein E7388_04070 [Ruminococcaceae bacterium]|nr:hypothetical protein [Oscillospiraceae bacterium]